MYVGIVLWRMTIYISFQDDQDVEHEQNKQQSRIAYLVW